MRGLTSVGCLTVESYLASHSAAMSSDLWVSSCNFFLGSVMHNRFLFTSLYVIWAYLPACASRFIPKSHVQTETGASFVMVVSQGIHDLFWVCGELVVKVVLIIVKGLWTQQQLTLHPGTPPFHQLWLSFMKEISRPSEKAVCLPAVWYYKIGYYSSHH